MQEVNISETGSLSLLTNHIRILWVLLRCSSRLSQCYSLEYRICLHLQYEIGIWSVLKQPLCQQSTPAKTIRHITGGLTSALPATRPPKRLEKAIINACANFSSSLVTRLQNSCFKTRSLLLWKKNFPNKESFAGTDNEESSTLIYLPMRHSWRHRQKNNFFQDNPKC